MQILVGREVVATVRKWLDLRSDPKEYSLTDLGNAKRLVLLHGEDIRYCHTMQSWLIRDGTRWRIDDSGEIDRRAKDTVLSIYQEAAQCPEEQSRRNLAGWAQRSESRTQLKHMEELARTEEAVIVRAHELDRGDYLLSCLNGTLNLRTGEFRNSDRADLCTRLCHINYDPRSECPRWDSFLQEITRDQPELMTYIQACIGYALTGDVSEHCMFFLVGTGLNGKSTFAEVIASMFGDYGQTADPSLLLDKRDTVPNDVARLTGVRFVSAVETGADKKLAVTLVKRLTGGDTITARFLHKEFFEFKPHFKLFVATNHLPTIKDGETAIWRRLKVIPFDAVISPEKVDKKLLGKLKTELPGILNWAIRGTKIWLEQGLGEPAAVKRATAAYRAEMDKIAQFLNEVCMLQAGMKAKAGALYEEYKGWCYRNGYEAASQNELGRYLAQKGLVKDRGTQGVRLWLGIGIRQGPF